MRNPTRVLAYCRVSARDRGEIEAQRQRHTRWCGERGYPAPIFFWEIESGGEERREKRGELDRLLGAARAGDLVTTILVDRWTRDVVNGVADVRTLLGRGVGWQAIDEGIDATTDEGKDQLGHRAAGAEAERRRIRRRTGGARNRLRDQGLWVEGPAPFGYRRGERRAGRQCHLEVEPVEAALVREAFERCAGGSSILDVSNWLNVERGTDRDRKVVHALLRNRIYLGETRSSTRTWIGAQWEPLITRDLFERVQEALRQRRKGGGPKAGNASRTAAWLLRGLGSCPTCGARMSASYSSSGHVGYYACGNRLRHGTCDAEYGRVDRIDARAGELALARLVELRVELATPSNDEQAPPPKVDFAARRVRLRAELERAELGWVKGLLTDDGLRRARERLDEDLGRLEVASAAAERAARATDPLARRRTLAEVARIEEAWDRAPVALRRACMAVLAARVVILGADVQIAWRTAAELSVATGGRDLFGATDDTPPPPPVAPARPKRGRR